jgi:uncharacterized protein
MRASIEALGGEYRFERRVDGIDVAIEADGTRRMRGLHLHGGDYLEAEQVVLAVGPQRARHVRDAARARRHIEAKPFSIGVRIEHPQSWIDKARFGPCAGHPILGAAEYHISHHCSNGRTVYSFCMCPGGTVVAATSEEGQVATNGMSQYSRNERNANSGFVVAIDPARDYPGPSARRHRAAAPDRETGVRCGRIELQGAGAAGRRFPGGAALDRAGIDRAVISAGRDADRPGATCLPDFVIAAMREALPVFGRQIAGYDHPGVVMTGVETRTSSPIRITRGDDLQSLNTIGLLAARRARERAMPAASCRPRYPDGIKPVAEAVARIELLEKGGCYLQLWDLSSFALMTWNGLGKAWQYTMFWA